MKIWRSLAVGITLAGVGLTGLFIGCTRQIAVNPTAPGSVMTSTFTITNTPAATATQTFTNTTSPTITNTPLPGNTATPTNTSTPAPATSTFTITDTPTATSTATATSTPTPNYNLIDDFENQGTGDNTQIADMKDQNGKYRNGYWFDYGSSNVGDSQSIVYTSAGYSSTNAVECSGALGTQTSDAGFGFSLVDPTNPESTGVTYYDATVGGLYTGISFYAKANSIPVTNCTGFQPILVNFVDDSGTDRTVAIPLTTTWTQFTIYFNQAISTGSAGTLVDATNLYQIKFEPQGNGVSNYNFDFLIDDIDLVSSAAPVAATPVPSNVLSTMQNGTNQIMYPAAIAQAQTPGYWYTVTDTYGTTMCPSGATGTIFFQSAPGQSNAGTDFAAHIAGVMYTNLGANYPYAEMGFNFINGTPPVAIDLGTYSGCSATSSFSFYMKSADANAVWFSCSSAGTTASSDTCGESINATAGWVQYTVPFSSMNTQGWGVTQPYLFSGTGAGQTGTPPYQQAIAPTWEVTTSGATYDVWVDNIQLNP